MAVAASASTNLVIRLEMMKDSTTFANIAQTISDAGGDIIVANILETKDQCTIRELKIALEDKVCKDLIGSLMNKLPGVRVLEASNLTFQMHQGGKIEVTPKIVIKSRDELSRVYTPGVADVCMAIHEDPGSAHELTIKRNTIAVVSDGTAVLGLGNIGPLAAMPVMEGKVMLFKQFANVDAFPICLDTQDTEEIIETVKRIAPAFGGINLEDISSPRCFEIERRLSEELDIPVFHDDQHGTAVVLLAGLYNAVKVVGKRLENCKIVLCGLGAAGVACTKILLAAGATRIIGVDREGAIVSGHSYERESWNWYAEHTNPEQEAGSLSDVIAGADIFIGVSGPGVLKREDVLKMAKDPIVFAMANPTPEILPEEAKGIVRVMATGRSDYPNQINNVLCFPGLFRGLLDCRATKITEDMKLAAAKAIASVIKEEELNEEYIIPSVFNPYVADKVKDAVIEVAIKSSDAARKS